MTTTQTRPDVDAERVLDTARELVPMLRANAQRAEDERSVPAENIQALTDAGTPDLRTAGVIAPTGTGVRSDGGVVVNGTWTFNTGCQHAQWGGLGAHPALPA